MSAAERREQLIDAASELVIERGFHEVSIDAIAKRSGITRAVVYQHFDDLTDLFCAVVDRALERASASAGTALADLPSGDDPHDLMLASVTGYVRAVGEDPASWQLVLRQPDGAPEAIRERLAAGRMDLLTQITGAVRPLLSGSDDPQLTASVLSTIATHYAHLALSDPKAYTPERVATHADWLIRGFLAGSR